MVRPGSVIADVGADHAALSLHLLKRGVCPRAVISDVRPMPLERAKRAVAESMPDADCSFYLADGIFPLLKSGAQTFAVCGMGGETIAGMFEGDRRALYGKTFILQPMTKIPFLREYLWTHGLNIQKEITVLENGRCFIVMLCTYDGFNRAVSNLDILIGKRRPKSTDDAFLFYCRSTARQLAKRVDGLTVSGGDHTIESALLGELTKVIDEVDDEKI